MRRAAAYAALVWGAAGVVVAVLHTGAATATAFRERGGLDHRWAVMLALGWVMLTVGAALAWCGWRLRQDGTRATHHRLALALAGFTLVWTSILVHVAGPVGVGGSAGTLALLWLGRPR
ncbi:MAG: hypothetical protein QOD77_103 [Thermoplasmata archaeon]|jgi:heme/copper-type cytochrome/quinol oxidase subunit 2|nr:hypothetical protein [Thermoplasmata archaeon]